MTDQDQGGRGFQRVRTYLGPTLGWKDELVSPSTEITVGGVYDVKPGDSLLLVDVSAQVQINLPDVVSWFQQGFDRPATAFERAITIKDIGGNAANFNIVVVPHGQQAIDNIQQAQVISQPRANVKLIPLADMSGWMVETAIGAGGGGGGGGGDVFKAGNNTFTGTNDFLAATTVPNQVLGDNSTKAANTSFVQGQGFITGTALVAYAPLFSPVFTGDPQAPTPGPGDNDTSVATTAFVQTALAGFSGGAPINAEYIVGALHGTLTNERLLTDSASIQWDLTVPGVVKANTIAGGGNVSNSGTPTINQLAQWVTSTTIKGVNINALGLQPLDGDLTALAALTGTNTIYYRSATDIWSPVTFSGLSFSGGVLTVTAAGGDVFLAGTNAFTGANSFAVSPTVPTAPAADNTTKAASTAYVKSQNYIDATALTPYAPLASPTFTGDPKAPTPATSDNDTSIATTAFVKAAIAGGSFTPIGFRALKNTGQNIGHNANTKIIMDSEIFDNGSFYDPVLSRWTPPAGLVHIDAQLWVGTNLDTGASGYLQVTINKNGSAIVTSATYPAAANQGVNASIDDVANGTDYYEMFGLCYAAVGGGVVVGGGGTLTEFNGHVTGGPKGDTGATGTAGTPGAPGASGSSLASPTWPQGRLTLAASTPIMIANIVAATTVIYTAYLGDRVPIYDGTNITMMGFSNLTSLNLSDTTRSPTAIGFSKVNDWFIWNDAGTLRLVHGTDWTADATRGSSTGIVRGAGGLWYNAAAFSGSINGPAAQRATWVGTTRTNGSGSIDWIYGGNRVGSVFNIWNAYNRVRVATVVTDDQGSWSYGSSTYRIRNSANTQSAFIQFVMGLQEDSIEVDNLGHGITDGSGNIPVNGIGINAVTTLIGKQAQAPGSAGNSGYMSAHYRGMLLGAHIMYAVEAANNAGTPTWYGYQAGPPARTMAYFSAVMSL